MWHHLCICYSSEGVLELYIDGFAMEPMELRTSDGGGDFTSSPKLMQRRRFPSTTKPVVIGKSLEPRRPSPFQGSIAQVRKWQRSRMKRDIEHEWGRRARVGQCREEVDDPVSESDEDDEDELVNIRGLGMKIANFGDDADDADPRSPLPGGSPLDLCLRFAEGRGARLFDSSANCFHSAPMLLSAGLEWGTVEPHVSENRWEEHLYASVGTHIQLEKLVDVYGATASSLSSKKRSSETAMSRAPLIRTKEVISAWALFVDLTSALSSLSIAFESALDDESAGRGVGMDIAPPAVCISPDQITFDLLTSLLVQLQWLTGHSGGGFATSLEVDLGEAVALTAIKCIDVVRVNIRQMIQVQLLRVSTSTAVLLLFPILQSIALGSMKCERVAQAAVETICVCLPAFFTSAQQLMELLDGLVTEVKDEATCGSQRYAEAYISALCERMGCADVMSTCFPRAATPRWLGTRRNSREGGSPKIANRRAAFDARSCSGNVVLKENGSVAVSSDCLRDATKSVSSDEYMADPLKSADSWAFVDIGFEAGSHYWDFRIGDKGQSGGSRVFVGAATKSGGGSTSTLWVLDTLSGRVHCNGKRLGGPSALPCLTGDVIRVTIDLSNHTVSFEQGRDMKCTFRADLNCGGRAVYPVVGFESRTTTCAVRLLRLTSVDFFDAGLPGLEFSGCVGGDSMGENEETTGPHSVQFMSNLLSMKSGSAATRDLLLAMQGKLFDTEALSRIKHLALKQDVKGTPLDLDIGTRVVLHSLTSTAMNDKHGIVASLLGAQKEGCYSIWLQGRAAGVQIKACNLRPLVDPGARPTTSDEPIISAVNATSVFIVQYATTISRKFSSDASSLSQLLEVEGSDAILTHASTIQALVWLLRWVVSPVLAAMCLPTHLPRSAALIEPLHELLAEGEKLRARLALLEGPCHDIRDHLFEANWAATTLISSVCADLVAARGQVQEKYLTRCTWAIDRADWWIMTSLLAGGLRVVSADAAITLELEHWVSSKVKVPLTLRKFKNTAVDKAMGVVTSALLHQCGLTVAATAAAVDAASLGSTAGAALIKVWTHGMGAKKTLARMMRMLQQGDRTRADAFMQQRVKIVVSRAEFLLELESACSARDDIDTWSEDQIATAVAVERFLFDGLREKSNDERQGDLAVAAEDLDYVLRARMVRTRDEVQQRILGYGGFTSVLDLLPDESEPSRVVQAQKMIVLEWFKLRPAHALIPRACSKALEAELRCGFENLFTILVRQLTHALERDNLTMQKHLIRCLSATVSSGKEGHALLKNERMFRTMYALLAQLNVFGALQRVIASSHEVRATESTEQRAERENITRQSVDLFVDLARQIASDQAKNDAAEHSTLLRTVFAILFEELERIELCLRRHETTWMVQQTAVKLVSLLGDGLLGYSLSSSACECLSSSAWISLVLRYALTTPIGIDGRRNCIRLLRNILPAQQPDIRISGLKFDESIAFAAPLENSLVEVRLILKHMLRIIGSSVNKYDSGHDHLFTEEKSDVGLSQISATIVSMWTAQVSPTGRMVFAAECVALMRSLLVTPSWGEMVAEILVSEIDYAQAEAVAKQEHEELVLAQVHSVITAHCATIEAGRAAAAATRAYAARMNASRISIGASPAACSEHKMTKCSER